VKGTTRAERVRFGRGFTLIELLIVLAVVGVLASLMVPVLRSGIERSQAAGCLANLSKIGKAVHSYAAEAGRLPTWQNGTVYGLGYTSQSNPSWVQLLIPYTDGSVRPWVCPASEGGEMKKLMGYPRAYTNAYSGSPSVAIFGANCQTIGIQNQLSNPADPSLNLSFGHFSIGRIRNSSKLIYAVDCAGNNDTYWQRNGGNGNTFRLTQYSIWAKNQNSQGIIPRHNGQANVLFLDGHTESVTRGELASWLQRAPNDRTEPHFVAQLP